MELNDLTFSLQNGVYKTSFQPTGDFRIHIKRQASGRLSFFETITGSDPVAFGVINWTLPNFEAKVPDVSPGMTIIIESDTPVIKCQYTYEYFYFKDFRNKRVEAKHD